MTTNLLCLNMDIQWCIFSCTTAICATIVLCYLISKCKKVEIEKIRLSKFDTYFELLKQQYANNNQENTNTPKQANNTPQITNEKNNKFRTKKETKKQ